MSRYYALVSGLRELHFGSKFDAGVRDVIRAGVERRDRELVDLLVSGDYVAGESSGSRFLREWSIFERELRNVHVMLSAKRLGTEAEFVGGGEVVEALKKGAKGDIPWMELLTQGRVIEREQAIDKLRWGRVDEVTVFNYFDIDKILGYLVKVSILERWSALSAEQGREALAAMVGA